MLRLLLIFFLIGAHAVHGIGQAEQSQGSSSGIEVAPAIGINTNAVVTFRRDHATPLQLIQATGRQTRVPIGVVLGKDPTLLSEAPRSYNLENVDAKSSLLEAIAGTGYSLNESNNVLVLIAGDLNPRQRMVLDHVYEDFKAGPDRTMVMLGGQLTMWMQAELDHVPGFGGSILYSPDDERFTLGDIRLATTEELANRIVSLGSKGMWTLTADAFQRDGEWTDSVKIEPYQHYSNRPNTDH
jgi:hypothetical protein